MSEILRLENVTKTFGSYTAIDHISFSLKKNSILGLLGPNGAGKTTLLRLITQIVLPDSGQIFFEGNVLSEAHRMQIGYLPEERGLYRKMRVQEQLIYFAQLRGMSSKEAKQQTTDWLTRLEITFFKDQVLETLSKGQQQKVQFISAVVHNPELLILDEPFSGFDPANAEVIKKEIKALHASGTTIIYSTHRMDTVEDVCTELLMIDHAKVVLQGEPNAIRKQFDKGYVRLIYSGALPTQIQSDIIEQKNIDATKVSYLLAPSIEKKQLLQLLINQGEVYHFEEHLPSMHEIFLQHVNKQRV
ncbi:ABC transporter ATP-binding protein [Cytophaga aurantiaca]|uniref:ABC transporter ATP-binding protein n=1 Tax=Cytophaga aurantiaca TaxID=29530 RepID=UPI0003782118|nr:ABC transporter ATP-binding protein [Cytophaga aurantiaca]